MVRVSHLFSQFLQTLGQNGLVKNCHLPPAPSSTPNAPSGEEEEKLRAQEQKASSIGVFALLSRAKDTLSNSRAEKYALAKGMAQFPHIEVRWWWLLRWLKQGRWVRGRKGRKFASALTLFPSDVRVCICVCVCVGWKVELLCQREGKKGNLFLPYLTFSQSPCVVYLSVGNSCQPTRGVFNALSVALQLQESELRAVPSTAHS